jgi:putative transposase
LILAHRIALDPTFAQRAYFARAAGTARFTWNWALAEWDRRYAAGEKPNGKTLKTAFNAIKYEVFPWLKNIHRNAHAQPFAYLQKAFVAFFQGTAERPSFKKKGKRRDSFYVANDKLRLDGCRLHLPVVGWVRLREPLRFAGKIVGAVVSREADRWFVSIQVDVGAYRRERTADGVVGVDLGLTAFATLSTGDKVHAPKPLGRCLRRLRLRQRSLSRRQKGSRNREKQRRKVARVYARVKNIRRDFCHKFTSRLCRENQAVGVETLNVAGLLRNHKLARAIADVAWGETLRQIAYKGPLFACAVIEAPAFELTTKCCHRCGRVKDEMPLSERVFRCEGCGLVCDRDMNAARNLVPPAWREVTAVDRKALASGLPTDVKPRRVEAATKPCSPTSTN